MNWEWVISTEKISKQLQEIRFMEGLKFEVGKFYRTRNSDQVRIYAVDGNGKRPIHGAIFDDQTKVWIPNSWEASGNFYGDGAVSDADLFPPWVKEDPELYKNMCDASKEIPKRGMHIDPEFKSAKTFFKTSFGNITVKTDPTLDKNEVRFEPEQDRKRFHFSDVTIEIDSDLTFKWRSGFITISKPKETEPCNK